jgi:4-carboxymuconolactone decarboxylase
MARLPYLRVEEAPEGSRRLLGKLPPLHVFGVLAHSPCALKGFVRLGSGLLYEGSLAPGLRELVILRVARLSGAAYEVAHHEDAARQLGVSEAQIAATAQGSGAGCWSEAEAAALGYAEEVLAQVKASAARWEAVERCFDAQQRVELTLLVGYYMMVARFLENLEVALEPEGTAGLRFAPSGQPSQAGHLPHLR